MIIGDTWQWTPFVFIVLLAALEGLDQEVHEAALVDGASRWQSFRHITMPALLPVTTTIVLIRLIEGFKIIDMPNILLGGGPGTATQSMTLQAYIDWNTLNLGRIGGGRLPAADPRHGRRDGLRELRPAPGHGPRMSEPVPPPVHVRTCRRRPSSRRSSLLLGWAFVVLFPIYWLFVTSFKTPYQVDKGPFYIPFVDFQPTLDAWRYILVELGNDTLRPYVNTVIVGLSSSRDRAGPRLARRPTPWSASPTGRGSAMIGLFIGCVALAFVGDRRSARRRPGRGRRRRSRSSRSSPRRSAAGSPGRSATATSRSG